MVAFCLCYWFSVFFFSDCPLQILLCPAVAAQGSLSVDTSTQQRTAQSDVDASTQQRTAQSDGKLAPGEGVQSATDTYFAARHSASSGQSVLCSSENSASGHEDSDPSPDGDSTCGQTVLCAGGDCRLAAVHLDVTISSVLRQGVDESVFSKPYLVKVPRHAPLTRRQYEESILYWPVTFHEDKRFIPPCCVYVGVQGFCCN